MWRKLKAGLLLASCMALTSAVLPVSAQPTVADKPDRLVLLGTKGGPSIRAKSPFPNSQVLIVGGVPYVIDAGYGVTRLLLQAGVDLKNLRYVFITHQHSDHNLEYGNLVYTAWANGLKTPVDAYGPAGMVQMNRDLMAANKFDIDTRIADEGRADLRKLVTAHDIDAGVIFQDERVKVTAMRNRHPPIVDSFAYKFETKGGKTIVFSGDTAYYPPLAEFAKGADVLVHEVMYGPGIEALAQRIANGATLLKHLKDSHTLTEDVGRIAAAAGVKTLVLSHFVPGDDPAITREMWESGARKHFDGKIIVGADLMEIAL